MNRSSPALLLLMAATTFAGSAAAQVPQDVSIYELQAKLQDLSGEQRPLDLARGGPVLVTMFYASCPHACPTLFSQIRKVEAQLPEAQREKLKVLLVSFDEVRDTPKVLTELAEAYGMDTKRWLLTRTSAESVQEIAAVLGIKYRFTNGGAVNHTSVITLLDAKGAVRARWEGPNQPQDELIAATLEETSR